MSEAPGAERFSVVVVDDERLIAEYVAKVVEELGNTDVHVYSDAVTAASEGERFVWKLLV